MSAQQVEEQDGGVAGPSPVQQPEPVPVPEPVGPVEVRRSAALGAVIGVAAAAVAIGWLGRAAGSGAVLDWAVCAVMAVLALVFLRSLFDARTPLLVIDELGVRMRLANHWRGLPWDAVETVTVAPRRGLLHDGRVVVDLHTAERAVEGLDGRARRQAALNRRLYGGPLAVPLGLTTRVTGADADEITDRVAALSEGRAEVVTLVAPTGRTAPTPPLADPEPDPEPDPKHGLTIDDDDDVELEPAEESVPVTGRGGVGGSLRRVRWLRRPGRPVEADPADEPDAVEAPDVEDAPAVPEADADSHGVDPHGVDPHGAEAVVLPAERVDQQGTTSSGEPVALRRIGEVTTAVTSAVTGAVTDVVTKAVAPVHERESADSRVRAIARLGDPVAPLVIDEFRPEPAYDPVVGPELAAARTRVGLSVDELADRTRIRPHVIESIEVDDFAPCGGDFYARGHIRTLARVLGKDPVPLLERFEERYASAPVNARTVFEAELSNGKVASVRRTSGGPNWALLVGAVLALALAWSLVRLLAGSGQEVLEDPPPMLNGSGGLGGIGAGVEPGRQDPASAGVAAPVATTLSAVGGGTDVAVRDGEGAVAFRGTLATGEVRQLEVAPPVTVVAGDGGVIQVSMEGRDLGLVGAAGERTTRTYRQPAR